MHTSFSHHQEEPDIRPSLHNGFSGLCRDLPGSPLRPPSLHRTPCGSSPGRMTLPSCNLNTSTRCQDHTVLPYASCSGVSHAGDDRTTDCKASALSIIPKTCPLHSASIVIRPAFRDDRDAPLKWTGLIRLSTLYETLRQAQISASVIF